MDWLRLRPRGLRDAEYLPLPSASVPLTVRSPFKQNSTLVSSRDSRQSSDLGSAETDVYHPPSIMINIIISPTPTLF